jgi:aconitase A
MLELGATTTVFPSDEAVKRFLESQGRGADWVDADAGADYDEGEESKVSELACKRNVYADACLTRRQRNISRMMVIKSP